jgi:site-specific DNA-cytosine methylase
MSDYRPLSNDENYDCLFEASRTPTPMGWTALGACIFGGAFSFGMEQAGITVAGHLELPDLALGVAPSRQRWPVAVLPFEGERSWTTLAKEVARSSMVDVVYANPPCVAYAGTGKREGSADDRMCYLRYCSYGLAMEIQPSIWCWELVPGVFDHERGLLDAMAFRASRKGYRSYAFLTSAAVHGGFQDRRRFHFIASKYELDFDGVLDDEHPERRGVRSLGEALAKVGPLGTAPNHDELYKGAFLGILPYCPPGDHLRAVPPSVMRANYRPRGQAWDGGGVPGFAHTRGRLDRPCPNILGGHTVFHPVEDRYITPREAATVMGFPLDYEFSPGTRAYAEIGKGLCTHNAAFVARVIRRALDDGAAVTPTPELAVVDWRGMAPKLNLRMSKAERRSWWVARHPDLPLPEEWA